MDHHHRYELQGCCGAVDLLVFNAEFAESFLYTFFVPVYLSGRKKTDAVIRNNSRSPRNAAIRVFN